MIINSQEYLKNLPYPGVLCTAKAPSNQKQNKHPSKILLVQNRGIFTLLIKRYTVTELTKSEPFLVAWQS